MKTVEECAYLGSVMVSNGNFTQDIESRKAAATRVLGRLRRRLWGRREVSLNTKINIFNAVVLPVLLYGATAWALTKTKETRLDAFVMAMLRNIAGVRWKDFVRNNNVRAWLKQPPVSLKLKSAKIKCLGHVERMEKKRR